MPKIKKTISDYSDVIVPEKFWAQVDVRGEDECWEWRRAVNTTGYGIYHCRSPKWLYDKNGRTMTQLLAHRVAWFLTRGEIGSDHVNNHVCHTCDNRRCCNPAHMFKGSMYDNVWDMIEKGRGAWQREKK